jgi:hypothetical protein
MIWLTIANPIRRSFHRVYSHFHESFDTIDLLHLQSNIIKAKPVPIHTGTNTRQTADLYSANTLPYGAKSVFGSKGNDFLGGW